MNLICSPRYLPDEVGADSDWYNMHSSEIQSANAAYRDYNGWQFDGLATIVDETSDDQYVRGSRIKLPDDVPVKDAHGAQWPF